jgi:hypothetical protein
MREEIAAVIRKAVASGMECDFIMSSVRMGLMDAGTTDAVALADSLDEYIARGCTIPEIDEEFPDDDEPTCDMCGMWDPCLICEDCAVKNFGAKEEGAPEPKPERP